VRHRFRPGKRSAGAQAVVKGTCVAQAWWCSNDEVAAFVVGHCVHTRRCSGISGPFCDRQAPKRSVVATSNPQAFCRSKSSPIRLATISAIQIYFHRLYLPSTVNWRSMRAPSESTSTSVCWPGGGATDIWWICCVAPKYEVLRCQ
jgi:hypothetical protein